MKKAELKEYIGKTVRINFKDGSEESGILGFTKEFSSQYRWRRPGYFTINNWDFSVSHVKKCEVVE